MYLGCGQRWKIYPEHFVWRCNHKNVHNKKKFSQKNLVSFQDSTYPEILNDFTLNNICQFHFTGCDPSLVLDIYFKHGYIYIYYFIFLKSYEIFQFCRNIVLKRLFDPPSSQWKTTFPMRNIDFLKSLT